MFLGAIMKAKFEFNQRKNKGFVDDLVWTYCEYSMIYYFHKEECDHEYTGTGLRVIDCIIAILLLHE